MRAKHNRLTATALLTSLVVLAFILLTAGSLPGKSKFTAHKLTILFTGDDFGNLKPGCG